VNYVSLSFIVILSPSLSLKGKLREISQTEAFPDKLTTPIAIIGRATGETLVGIDVRPQNGLLYGLGVDAATDTGSEVSGMALSSG
jgi:Domain of unknown function (DUF4394)